MKRTPDYNNDAIRILIDSDGWPATLASIPSCRVADPVLRELWDRAEDVNDPRLVAQIDHYLCTHPAQ